MLRQDIFAVVRDLVSEVCYIPVPEMDDKTDLFFWGLDSISVIRLMILLHERFDLDFSWQDFYATPSVNGIVDMIESKLTELR